ncbi:MAG: Holliday junction resolvase RuvX [Gammaproteobacteria bacterium]|nr:Holliday junction resolvase RuvX [Gammaproteobacteria bacterium]
MPGTPETIIAFDFGLRRIGVAVGQQVTNSARPLESVSNGDGGPDWQRIEAIVREWGPQRLIVGMPMHADGSPSEIGKTVRKFIEALGRFELPVEAVDERYSSIEAEAVLKSQREEGLRGRISKEAIDSAAATLIAERWLKNEL